MSNDWSEIAVDPYQLVIHKIPWHEYYKPSVCGKNPAGGWAGTYQYKSSEVARFPRCRVCTL